MKKYIVFSIFSLTSLLAHADDSFLSRALTCGLNQKEVPDLLTALKAEAPEFTKPSRELALPAMNVYELKKPVTAIGYTSSTVVILPGRVLLAVKDERLADVVAKNALTPQDLRPASREVGPNRFIVAYQVGDPSLSGKVLVGCEYRMREAAWPLDSEFDEILQAQ